MKYKQSDKMKERIRHTVRFMLANPRMSRIEITKRLEIDSVTIYRHLKSETGINEILNHFANHPDLIDDKYFRQIICKTAEEKETHNNAQ